MSRYIDADIAKNLILNDMALAEREGKDLNGYTDALFHLKTIPTADVVEVVRCKDCKFWGIPHANDIEKAHYCCRDNMWCMPSRFANDYCSYGERREE